MTANDRPRFLSSTRILAAVVTLGAIGLWMVIWGQTMFSPGGLNAQAKTQPIGGVTTHAQIGRDCGACHAAPWSAQTMDDRCVACHTDVATQISGNTGLHGGFVKAMGTTTCRVCHSEHLGPNGGLTANFDHSKFPFKLTGAHLTVPCQDCHTNVSSLQDFKNTPTDCYSCHAKDDHHNGTFGTQCGACHTTTSWSDVTFNHTVFPIDHGTNQQSSTCTTCHPNSDFSTYTCLNCHFHAPARVLSDHEGKSLAALADCIQCHPGGKAAGGG